MANTRFDKLAEIGCIVCRLQDGVKVEANIHHLTGIKFRAMGKKAKDDHTIPLCHAHHQGKFGIHTIGMRPWEAVYGKQEYLLGIVNELIGEPE